MENLPTPLSRVELYLAKACEMDVTTPEPESRLEHFLYAIAYNTTPPSAGYRTEEWLAYVQGVAPQKTLEIEGACLIGNEKVDVRYFAVAAGVSGATLPPKPQNRKEEYWAYIATHRPTPGILKYVTGTNITLTDVVRGIEDLQFVYGDTYQQTYSGKNLLPFVNQDFSISGVRFYVDHGLLYLDGTATNNIPSNTHEWYDNITFTLPAGTYTLRGDTSRSKSLRKRSDNTIVVTASIGTPSSTFTLTEQTEVYYCMYIDSGASFTNYKFDAQLEIGSTATPYEPYTGGIPAPNPDYPQDVQTVTGEQTVTVSNGVSSQSYPISLTGKNLFNVSATPTYLNGVSVSGNLTVTATSSGTNKYALYRLVEAKNYVGSKVCVSCSTMHPSSTNDARIEIGLCNADGTSKTPKAYTNNVNIRSSFTVTDDPSKPYIYVALYASYSSSASVGNYVGYGKVMVNRGSTPGTYASYSPIELCKLSSVSGAPSILNYQDYIYKSGSDWYIHKEIEKAVYDGSVDEEWGLHNTYNSIVGFKWSGAGAGHSNSAILSEKLLPIYITTYNSNNRTYGKIATLESSSTSVNSAVFITAPNSSVTTLAQFTSWLSNNNVTVYYASATPTDTKITDATLVGQLNAIDSAVLPKPIAYITVGATDQNLPAPLKISYYGRSA